MTGDETIVCEDEQGLVFYRARELASLVMESAHRCRVVDKHGQVSFRRELPVGPWVRLAGAMVLPVHLTNLEKSLWSDPAGFVYVGKPEAEGSLDAEEEVITAVGIPLAQVLAIRSSELRKHCVWVTESGEIQHDSGSGEAAAAHPELVLVRHGLYLNRKRLRRIMARDELMDLVMDNGVTIASVTRGTAQNLAERLGLAGADHLEPPVPGLQSYFLRDWPFELASAPADLLRRHFDSPRKLIAHMLYQAVRYRMLGIKRRYGKTHRGFWYRPLHSALYRAGFLRNRRVRWVEPGEQARSSDEEMCLYYYRILEEMTGVHQLFTFQELGFKDQKVGARRLGKKRPAVLLLAEKESIADYGLAIHHRFGISYVETGGFPKLIASEFLARRLLEAGITEVELMVGFVDFDPDGWAIVDAQVKQLARYGIQTARPPVFVVTGELFSPEEIELLARPCAEPGSVKVQNWLIRSGGIDGKPWRIHANHFEPLERVLARVRELL